MNLDWLRSRTFWLLVFFGILIALASSTLPIKEWFSEVKDWLVTLGPWSAPAFILVYLLATIFGLPSIILILFSGTLFGLIKGIISVSIADTLGAIACFLIGRTIARKRIKRWIKKHPKFNHLDQAINKKGWKILLLSRLSPLIPSNLLNYGFSCTKVNFWQYCFFSWLGMLPVIIMYVYLGAFGSSLIQRELTPGKIALQAAGFLGTIAIALYTTRLTQRALKPECPQEE